MAKDVYLKSVIEYESRSIRFMSYVFFIDFSLVSILILISSLLLREIVCICVCMCVD